MAASWELIPCLKCLFAEFDLIAPGRDHASDGSIGDTAHQHETSDHNPDETGSVPIHDADHVNEVHAIDVDNTLRRPDLGSDPMEDVVQFLLGRCRSGAEKRLRYIIYNRRIWSASSDWVQKKYTGPSPHTEHAHFSASYDSKLEASTTTWGLIGQFGKKGSFVADLSEQQQQNIDQRVWHTWLMMRNVESMLTALLAGAGQRPKWDDATTGYTFPATQVFPNVALGRLTADGVSDADLKAALESLPDADENARAVVEALAGQTPEATAAALRVVLGNDAAAVGRILAGS